MLIVYDQKGSAKTDTLVRLVLVFFISLLSFSVGTFVGKQFSDSQHNMAKLENNAESEGNEESHSEDVAHSEGESDREVASIDPNSTEVTPENSLTSQDIDKFAEDFAKEGSQEEAKDEKNVAKQAEPTEEKPVKDSVQLKKVQKVAEKIAQGKPITEPETTTEVRVPSSLPNQVKPSAEGKYTVQISSFQVEADAKQRAEELKAKGFSAFYIPADVKGTTWYRVNVGQYTTQEEAKKFSEELKAQANIKNVLIQKIVK
jgi:cell division protein FtsN